MNIILVGPPGAGKGTQSDKLVNDFNLQKLSTGDILREEINKKTTLGNEIKLTIDKGNFVSDTIINNLSHFTNSFNPLAVPTSSGFNDVPTSGGRVYLFEKEQATSGVFYNEDKYIWSVTQEFGLDKYLYRQKYLNRGYGHAVSISKDTSKIAIGSPFADSVGVRVYEKDPSYKLTSLYNKVTRWLTRRVEENIDDVTGLYAQLLQTYDNYYSTTLSHEAAGKLLYENLDPSGRFDLRFYCDTLGGGTKDKYTEVFTYKNDYNRQGTWDFVPENLAPKPRVGYSVSLNDDGNILAVGCPTDSMNQHDDTNVYPDGPMKGLTALPNGIMAGFTGKRICFSEAFLPHAWPANYRITLEEEIVGMEDKIDNILENQDVY